MSEESEVSSSLCAALRSAASPMEQAEEKEEGRDVSAASPMEQAEAERRTGALQAASMIMSEGLKSAAHTELPFRALYP